MDERIRQLGEEVLREQAPIRQLTDEVGRVIVGQQDLVEKVVIGLLCHGHVLLEGVPGLAKTLLVSTLAACFDASFRRIQFTPDLLPADLVGTLVYDPRDNTFLPHKGPIFANVILADEINRAPAKVQSALLEAMQERQVTIGETTFPLPSPFLVLATQNPLEQEGTYPLPEAQVDRFLMKVLVDYPERDEEKLIVRRMATAAPPDVRAVLGPADVERIRELVGRIHLDERVEDYIIDLVRATRSPETHGVDAQGLIHIGASPRASLALAQTSRAHAFLRGRGFVTPEDVKAVGYDVLRHRLIPSFEAEAEEISADELVQRIFDAIEVP
ncbi:MAG TPA: MoxR family ATPase [Acidobacteria bacterium]|nr:MoxR family ATPase [Acidobacteriota bacterium]